jgi:hypothetical protein
MPTMGKRRLPCSSVDVSAAKLQNCATVTVLKTPTHKKKKRDAQPDAAGPQSPEHPEVHGEEEGRGR